MKKLMLTLGLVLCFAQSAIASRLALVIGNDLYQAAPALKNARNDARLIAATLKDAGYEVVGGVRENLGEKAMWRAIDQFAQRVQYGDEVAFFFAGHGVQLRDTVLLPVDIQPDNSDQVERDGVPLGVLQDKLSRAKLALLIIDACRDNPFPTKPGTRSLGETRGLAPPASVARGSAVLLAAGRGQKALDYVPGGTQGNGLFSHELNALLRTPGMGVISAARTVRDRVESKARSASHEQRPTLVDDVSGDYVMFPLHGGGQGTQVVNLVPESAPLLTPPGRVGVTSLEDLKKEEAARHEWAQWQAKMKAEFDQVAAFNGSPDLQVRAWERFLDAWGQDNPLSSDDDSLRSTTANNISSLKDRIRRVDVEPNGSSAVANNREPLRSVNVVAPDIAENGSVVPVGVTIGSGLRPGQVLQIFVGNDLAANVQVQNGVLMEFQTRVILPHSNVVVSARQGGIVLASKQVLVTVPGTPFRSASFSGDTMRLRMAGDLLRVLVSAESLAGGTTRMTSDLLNVLVENTGYIPQNPFYSFKADQPIRGEACITVSAAGKSRTDCTR